MSENPTPSPFADDFIEGWIREAERDNKRNAERAQKEAEAHPVRMIDGVIIDKVHRSYIATIPSPSGKVIIDFSEVIRSRQSFEVMLNITMHHTTEGKLPSFEQRIDLNSQNALATLATTLNKAYGKEHNWVLMLNKAGNALKKLIAQEKKPLTARDEITPVDFLLFPFLQRGSTNMIYADSEVGKSFFALYLASVSAGGGSFFGHQTKQTKTLYLDYEDDFDTFSFRLHSIAKGNNLTFNSLKEHVKYHKPDGDMVDETEIIARMVEEGGFDLIIIDAGSSATGGDPLNSTPVIKLFDALERIPCTKLIIHHEGKVTEGKTDGQALYGTTFWKARLRVGWRLSCLEEAKTERGSQKTIKVSMFKGSNLPRQDSFIYSIEFHSEGVSFALVDDYEEPREAKIVHFLTENPKSSYNAVADAIGIPRTSVQRILHEMKERDILRNEKGEGKTSPIVWSVA